MVARFGSAPDPVLPVSPHSPLKGRPLPQREKAAWRSNVEEGAQGRGRRLQLLPDHQVNAQG